MHHFFKKKGFIFFKRLESWIDKYTLNHDVLIVCGDFYCQKEKCNDKSVTAMKKLLKRFTLNDACTKC